MRPLDNCAWRRHVPLLLILAAGLVLRLVLLQGTAETPLKIDDEQQYYQLAQSLYHGDGFAWTPDQPTSLRPPLYPAFIAMVWVLNGRESLVAVRAVQVLLSLATVVLLYLLALRLYDRRAALVGAGLLCFYPELMGFNFLLLTETLFTFWLLLFALLFVTLVQTGRLGPALLTGMVLGLATLTRSVLWLFPLVAIPLVLWFLPRTLGRRVAAATLLLIGYGLAVGPWAVRNTLLQQTVTVVDSMGGITLRMGNYEYTPEGRAWDPRTLHGEHSIFQELREEHSDVALWTEGQKDKWAQRKAVQYMLAHPGTTLRRAAIKFADFWGLERTLIAGWQQGLYHPPVWLAILGTLLIPTAYAGVVLMASVGVFRAVPSICAAHALFVLLIAYISAVHSVAFGHPRYHLPLLPLLCLYAGAALTSAVWVRLHDGIRPALAPALMCLLWIGIWSREVFVTESERIRGLLSAMFG